MDQTVRNRSDAGISPGDPSAASPVQSGRGASTAASTGTTFPASGRTERGVTCAGCRQLIRDQFVLHVNPDLDWHASCLRCVECRRPLDESCTCFVRDGRPYCKADYVRLFSVHCSRCGLGFDRVDHVMRARDRVYHVDCFTCVACNRKLITGDEFALRPIDFGLVCRTDYDVINMAFEMQSVNGVAGSFPFPGLDIMGCISGLGDDSADDAIDDSACRGHHSSVSATALTAGFCVNNINNNNNNENEIEMRNKPNGATQGVDDRPASRAQHVPPAPLSSQQQQQSQPAVGASSTRKPAAPHHHIAAAGAPTAGQARHHGGGSTARKSSGDHQRPPSAKTTRVRTVLNEKQLHTLRTCYAANPRPDALMKDQLVEMTGLSSRVIRVWFQNKRCKDKKRTILIKQLQQQHQDKVHGVPMIASSPVRMQDQSPSILHASAVQIHHQYIQHPSVAPQQLAQSSAAVSTSAGAWPDFPSRSPSSSALTPPADSSCCSLDTVEPPSVAFQQLLDSFGCQSDDEDDTVVSVDEPLMMMRAGHGSLRALQLPQSRGQLPGRTASSAVVNMMSAGMSSGHLVCTDARC